MADVEIPNFGEVLAEHLGDVDPEGLPFLLSQLERAAADRYRQWAEELPDHGDGLRACAASEDEIADRAEALFPPTDDHRAQVAAVIESARAAYAAVFEGLTPIEQLTIQADAERQGASAWRGLAATHPDAATELEAIAALEITSAERLDGLLATIG